MHDTHSGDVSHFGRWLSRQRKAFDLTQEELADRVGCSIWYIQKIEADSRHPSKQVAEMLADLFHIAPAEREAFLRFARGRAGGWESFTATIPRPPSPVNDNPDNPGNLPVQLTSFVGRAAELPIIRDLMLTTEVRLLTLTGPPGTGKTRLALQTAAELLREFEDGVFFVDLAPITDQGLVVSEIAQSLAVGKVPGRSILEGVQTYLKGSRVLLILDNFEQVVEAAPLVSQLLALAPGLKVMATSRVPLHVRGEKVFVVPPMHLPDLEHLPPLERLNWYEAVQLFVQRATDVSAGFELTSDNASAVAHICTRLDGLPLAIELVAARVKVLSPESILDRLESRLDLLTGGHRDLPARQRTVRQAIEWSYDLLDESEKKLFRRLGVFRSGGSLQAIEAVCNPEGVPGILVLDGVSSLVEKGLLRREEGAAGTERFAMLETIHEYAREKLRESGEEEELSRAHADFFRALAEAAEPEIAGVGQKAWLDRLEEEHDNLRAALRWAQQSHGAHATEIELSLVGSLARFWFTRGHIAEGRRYLEAAVTSNSDAPAPLRARALLGAGLLAYGQSDLVPARAYLEQSLAIFHELDDRSSIAQALNYMGNVSGTSGRVEEARVYYTESLGIFRALGNRRWIFVVLHNLGDVISDIDPAAAHRLLDESLALARELGDKGSMGLVLGDLAAVSYAQSDYDSARSLFEQTTAIARELQDTFHVAGYLHGLGNTAREQGDYREARSHYEESLSLNHAVGDRWAIANLLNDFGRLEYKQGSYMVARSYHLQSLGLCRGSDNKEGIQRSLSGLADVASMLGFMDRAARLWGAAEAVGETVTYRDGPVSGKELVDHARNVTATRERAANKEHFDSCWAEGRAMSTEQAIAYALEE